MVAAALMRYNPSARVGVEGNSEGSCVEATKGEAMSRRRSPVISSSAESAMTWFFAGLVLIALVAGLVGQVAAG
jgi:hypothetical protein